jgi:hypothetical protein
MSETSLKDTVIAGLPLRQYVAVYAAVGEGFPLETVLKHEALDAAGWGHIDKAWADALVQSADTDLELVEAHDALLLDAQDRFWRAIPPVSVDLEAWLDFFRRVTSSDDPFALLASFEMRGADLMRLHRYWSDRIAGEAPLQEQALRISAQEPGPLPMVSPDPVKLPPPVGSGGAGPSADPVTAATNGRTTAIAGSPPLLAPLPSIAVVPPPRPSTPDDPPASLREEPSMPSDSVRHAVQPAVVSPPPAEQVGARLGLVSYASACAEAAVRPERTAAAWAKYGLSGIAIAAEHDAWRTQFQRYPEERAEFDRHFEQFEEHWRLQRP